MSEHGFCPFHEDRECNAGCALWSFDSEACAIRLIGEGMIVLSDIANDIDIDKGVRVHVTKFER